MNDFTASKKWISRRSLLTSAPMIAGAVFSLEGVPFRSAAAQTRLSHDVAKYQDTPKNGQQCSTCVNFVEPASCKIVADPISPQGWCQFYGKKPA